MLHFSPYIWELGDTSVKIEVEADPTSDADAEVGAHPTSHADASPACCVPTSLTRTPKSQTLILNPTPYTLNPQPDREVLSGPSGTEPETLNPKS
jgi:hypothetical protein